MGTTDTTTTVTLEQLTERIDNGEDIATLMMEVAGTPAGDALAEELSKLVPADDDDGYFSFTTFGAVKVNDRSRVTIPADRAADFARAATYFSGHSNRHTLSVTMPSVADAKLLARQLRQYAEDHGLSTSPHRDTATVTWRFAKPAARKASPVKSSRK